VHKTIEFIGGLAVLAALSSGGALIAGHTGIAVPGPVLGMLVYTGLLLGTTWLDWTLGAARLVASLIGALLVAPLVGVALFGDVAARGGVRLAVLLVVSTALTALATAWLFRAAGGKA